MRNDRYGKTTVRSSHNCEANTIDGNRALINNVIHDGFWGLYGKDNGIIRLFAINDAARPIYVTCHNVTTKSTVGEHSSL